MLFSTSRQFCNTIAHQCFSLALSCINLEILAAVCWECSTHTHILDLSRSLSSPVSLHNTPPPLPYKRGLPLNPNLTYTKPFLFNSGDTVAYCPPLFYIPNMQTCIENKNKNKKKLFWRRERGEKEKIIQKMGERVKKEFKVSEKYDKLDIPKPFCNQV